MPVGLPGNGTCTGRWLQERHQEATEKNKNKQRQKGKKKKKKTLKGAPFLGLRQRQRLLPKCFEHCGSRKRNKLHMELSPPSL